MAQTGVQCPQCWCKHTKVTQTVEREVRWGGKVRIHTRRYRECQRCFIIFKTVEVIEDEKSLGFPPREAQPEIKPKRQAPHPFHPRIINDPEDDEDDDDLAGPVSRVR